MLLLNFIISKFKPKLALIDMRLTTYTHIYPEIYKIYKINTAIIIAHVSFILCYLVFIMKP